MRFVRIFWGNRRRMCIIVLLPSCIMGRQSRGEDLLCIVSRYPPPLKPPTPTPQLGDLKPQNKAFTLFWRFFAVFGLILTCCGGRVFTTTIDGQVDVVCELHGNGTCNRRTLQLPPRTRSTNQSHLTTLPQSPI